MSKICHKNTWKDNLQVFGFIAVLIGLLFALIYFDCEKIEYYENGVPAYFLEPEGYVIADVDLNDGKLLGHSLYGYISEEDYHAYLDGTLNSLTVWNPYTEGKCMSTTVDKINFITIGEYKDYREYMD